jgi:hypothetical protein
MQYPARLSLVVVCLVAACGSALPTSAGGGKGGGDPETGGSGGDGNGGNGGNNSAGRGGSSGKGGGPSGSGGSAGGGTSGTSGGTGGEDAAAGTGGSGEAPDASAPAPDTAPAGGGCGSAKFCTDFEDQTAMKEPTGMFKVDKTGGATVTVDDTKAFSGTKSILFRKAGGYPGTFLTFSNIAAMIPSNDLHGRVMMWMTQTPGKAHWDGIWGTGNKPGGGTATYILGGMYGNFMAVYHPGDCSTDSKTPFPTGRWACIQWEFKGTKDGKHLHRMLLDGQVVDNGVQDGSQGVCASGGGTHDWAAPIFNTLKVGYVAYGGGSGDIWFDDLAFGEEPIACPPMK